MSVSADPASSVSASASGPSPQRFRDEHDPPRALPSGPAAGLRDEPVLGQVPQVPGAVGRALAHAPPEFGRGHGSTRGPAPPAAAAGPGGPVPSTPSGPSGPAAEASSSFTTWKHTFRRTSLSKDYFPRRGLDHRDAIPRSWRDTRSLALSANHPRFAGDRSASTTRATHDAREAGTVSRVVQPFHDQVVGDRGRVGEAEAGVGVPAAAAGSPARVNHRASAISVGSGVSCVVRVGQGVEAEHQRARVRPRLAGDVLQVGDVRRRPPRRPRARPSARPTRPARRSRPGTSSAAARRPWPRPRPRCCRAGSALLARLPRRAPAR